jgi:hypothetical protein
VYKIVITISVVLSLCFIPTVDAAQVLFTPELVFSGAYTDNLFLESENEDWDYITTAGVDLTNEILWRSAGIRLNYNPSYNMYTEHKALNYWRHAATCNIWKIIQRNTRLEINDTYLRSNDPLDESVRDTEAGEPQGPDIEIDPNRRGRSEYYTNVAEARLSHQFGADDDIFIAVQYRVYREVEPLPYAEVDNYDTVAPSMGLVFHFTQQWSTELDANYEETQYTDRNDRNEYNADIRFLYGFNRKVTGFMGYRHTILRFNLDEAPDEENYDIYSPSVGLRYEVGDTVRIEIAAAYYAQKFDHSEDEDGYIVNSDMDARWRFRTSYVSLSGGSGYDIDDDATADNRLNIYGHLRLGAGYYFSPHVEGSVYGRYRYDEFPNEEPVRLRHTSGAGAALNWQAARWADLILSCDYSNVNSDDATEEYSETRATLTLRIHPANPYRMN